MMGGDGAHHFEILPAAPRARWKRQAIDRGKKRRRASQRLGPGLELNRRARAAGNARPRHLERCHGVVELLAVEAKDGLRRKLETAVRATANGGPITAFGTFKKIRDR